MTLTLLDLYNSTATQEWSMYDNDAASDAEFEQSLVLAINKALDSIENVILENHLQTCIANKIEHGNTEEVSKEIMDLFKKIR